MGQRHKHADVIIAWAEGKDVQVWDFTQNEWGDVTTKSPTWCECWKYRIKPPADKYRVAMLFNDDNEPYTVSVDSQDYADIIEQRGNFGRWLTDWIEYEE